MYWDERDRYSSKEKELLKELGADKFGCSICITEVGTVYYNLMVTEKELSFEKFIKDIEKKIIKNKPNERAAIKYDKEDNKFYLIIEEDKYYTQTIAHVLDIKKEAMEGYVFGKNNDVISKLHDLYLMSMTNEEKENLKIKREQEVNAIILKTRQRHELPTLAEAKVYSEYLEDTKKANNKVIKSKASRLAGLVGTPLISAFSAGLAIITSMNDEMLIETLFAVPAGIFSAFIVLLITDDIVHDKTSYWGVSDYVEKAAGTIKEKYNENNIINTKLATLNSRIEGLSKVVIANGEEVPEDDNADNSVKIELLNLKDSVMHDLDVLVSRAGLLNYNDKMAFITEASEILEEYTVRAINIANQDKNVINLGADNSIELKFDMIKRITDLEIRINEARQKDIEIMKIIAPAKLLKDKMDGFSDFDLELQRTHNITQNKVRVRTLERHNHPRLQEKSLSELKLELAAE
ncbi:MAG: hypothetical protein IJI58_01150 [Bacilli bacterium]|nr:hypothetical protein [Bacilli bacterium]